MKSYVVLDDLSLDSLYAYGFDASLTFTFSLLHAFQCSLQYKKEQFFIQVFDQEGEEYYPFYVTDALGTFVGELKEEVQKRIEDIIEKCRNKNKLCEEILSYVKEVYGVLPKFPFSNDNISMTLTNEKNKWFGLIMKVKATSLEIKSDQIIDILNIKCNPDKIQKLVDNKRFFKAYHMNKKYWLTILLNNQISFLEIKELLDDSYHLIS